MSLTDQRPHRPWAGRMWVRTPGHSMLPAALQQLRMPCLALVITVLTFVVLLHAATHLHLQLSPSQSSIPPKHLTW